MACARPLRAAMADDEYLLHAAALAAIRDIEGAAPEQAFRVFGRLLPLWGRFQGGRYTPPLSNLRAYPGRQVRPWPRAPGWVSPSAGETQGEGGAGGAQVQAIPARQSRSSGPPCSRLV